MGATRFCFCTPLVDSLPLFILSSFAEGVCTQCQECEAPALSQVPSFALFPMLKDLNSFPLNIHFGPSSSIQLTPQLVAAWTINRDPLR